VIVARRPRLQRAGRERSGRVRPARVTDLAAVGELSRQSHNADDPQSEGMRTLGLPVGNSHISVFSLFRLPLGAFMPNDLLYVYEESGRILGLARVEHDGVRDEWTIVELDAIDNGTAGDIRFRLVQQVLRDASKRGGTRFHVSCADIGGNVELFMQAGFARYGEEHILFRPPTDEHVDTAGLDAAARGIRPTTPLDANELDRLYRRATPVPVARLESYRLQDWERQGSHWRVPRSSMTPILRFADVEGFVQERSTGPAAFVQVGVAKEEQPHYLRIVAPPDHDPTDLIEYGLAFIAERTQAGGWTDRTRTHRPDRGVISVVRTYEAPLDRRLEDHGFTSIANVSLLMRELVERVRQPALVPVVSR
jgi:hypothetical protein